MDEGGEGWASLKCLMILCMSFEVIFKKETLGRNFTRTKFIPTMVICALPPPTLPTFYGSFFLVLKCQHQQCDTNFRLQNSIHHHQICQRFFKNVSGGKKIVVV